MSIFATRRGPINNVRLPITTERSVFGLQEALLKRSFSMRNSFSSKFFNAKQFLSE